MSTYDTPHSTLESHSSKTKTTSMEFAVGMQFESALTVPRNTPSYNNPLASVPTVENLAHFNDASGAGGSDTTYCNEYCKTQEHELVKKSGTGLEQRLKQLQWITITFQPSYKYKMAEYLSFCWNKSFTTSFLSYFIISVNGFGQESKEGSFGVNWETFDEEITSSNRLPKESSPETVDSQKHITKDHALPPLPKKPEEPVVRRTPPPLPKPYSRRNNPSKHKTAYLM